MTAKGTEKHIHSFGSRKLQPVRLHAAVMSLPSAAAPNMPACTRVFCMLPCIDQQVSMLICAEVNEDSLMSQFGPPKPRVPFDGNGFWHMHRSAPSGT